MPSLLSRQPHLTQEPCLVTVAVTLERVKDSLYRAGRAHDERRLSTEPLPIPPHGPSLAHCKPSDERVRLTATHHLGYRKVTSQAALGHSHARLVMAATQRRHDRQRLR